MDPVSDLLVNLLILLVLILLSAFFSGSETALTATSKARVKSLLKEGRPGAAVLWKVRCNTTRMLVVILIGNNLVNIAASAFATVLATRWFGQMGPGIAVGVLTILILVFGEVTPKTIAARSSLRVSLAAAPVLLAVGYLMRPPAWLLERFLARLQRVNRLPSSPTVTEMELRSLLEHGAMEGTIEGREREMIERVFAFNDLWVRDVMTPRVEVFSLDGSRTVREALPELLEASVSRIPLWQGDPDDIKGVLYLRSVLDAVAEERQDATLLSIADEPLFVPPEQPIDELFTTLRDTKRHLAVVVNEYGTLLGIVSLEDLLEELVGEIYDETDVPPEPLQQIAPGVISVSGRAELRQLQVYYARDDLDGKPTDTVSLWILQHLQKIPEPGESFRLAGLQVTVEEATRRRIDRVRVEARPDI